MHSRGRIWVSLELRSRTRDVLLSYGGTTQPHGKPCLEIRPYQYISKLARTPLALVHSGKQRIPHESMFKRKRYSHCLAKTNTAFLLSAVHFLSWFQPRIHYHPHVTCYPASGASRFWVKNGTRGLGQSLGSISIQSGLRFAIVGYRFSAVGYMHKHGFRR